MGISTGMSWLRKSIFARDQRASRSFVQLEVKTLIHGMPGTFVSFRKETTLRPMNLELSSILQLQFHAAGIQSLISHLSRSLCCFS